MPSPSRPSSPFPSTGATTVPPEAPPSPSAQSSLFSQGLQETDEASNERASDGTDSEYHSFSDSDSEDDEATMTEEERRLEREMRAAERQLVLEAAGIVVKQDTTRRPPPRVQRRRTVTSVRPRHRPAPAPPIASAPSNGSDVDKPQPPTPTQAHIDDAYDRYEAFKQHTSRLSVSSIELPPPSPVSVSSSSLSLGQAQPRESYNDKDKGKESVNTSVSYGSRITQLLARARTPVQEREARVISAPILSTSSSSKGTLGAITREDGPAFGSVCGPLTLQEIRADWNVWSRGQVW